MGFSHITALPASRAAIVKSLCALFDAVMNTSLICGSESTCLEACRRLDAKALPQFLRAFQVTIENSDPANQRAFDHVLNHVRAHLPATQNSYFDCVANTHALLSTFLNLSHAILKLARKRLSVLHAS